MERQQALPFLSLTFDQFCAYRRHREHVLLKRSSFICLELLGAAFPEPLAKETQRLLSLLMALKHVQLDLKPDNKGSSLVGLVWSIVDALLYAGLK